MFDLSILASYSFLVVALGTLLLSISAASVGCITVLKGQSLIGDAIGHSTFPGIVLAFMVFQSRNPLLLSLGALVSGGVAFFLIQLIHQGKKTGLDSILAIVLSSFFGLGMVLKSYVQGNPNYMGASQSGIKNYIFGQAAYMMKSDVKMILVVSILVLLFLIVFYKEIKVFVFDEVYSRTTGINPVLMYGVMMVSAMVTIVSGLKLVGAILISSFLIIPAITALQWSNNLSRVMALASLIAGISSLVGTYISTVVQGMSTGPTIIVVMTSISFVSLVFSPKGILANMRMRRRYRR